MQVNFFIHINRLTVLNWIIEIELNFQLIKTWFKSEFLIQVFKLSQRIKIEYWFKILNSTRQDRKIERWTFLHNFSSCFSIMFFYHDSLSWLSIMILYQTTIMFFYQVTIMFFYQMTIMFLYQMTIMFLY